MGQDSRDQRHTLADELDLLTREEAAGRLADELAELQAAEDTPGVRARIGVLERAIARLVDRAPLGD